MTHEENIADLKSKLMVARNGLGKLKQSIYDIRLSLTVYGEHAASGVLANVDVDLCAAILACDLARKELTE